MTEDYAGLVITIDDVIPPKGPYCVWGAKYWASLHGIDFRDFLKSGISAERLIATGDKLVETVIARKLRGQNGQ